MYLQKTPIISGFLVVFLLGLVSLQSPMNLSVASSYQTPTSAATISPSPWPKDSDKLTQVRLLFSNSDNCKLPCWWGFQPRKATIADIQDAIKQDLESNLSAPYQRADKSNLYTLELDFHSVTEHSLEIGFVIREKLLVSTEVMLIEPIKWLEPQAFDLTQLLMKLGQPTESYIGINPSTRLFALYLFYNDRGVAAEYIVNFPDQQIIESTDPIPLCPRPGQIDHIKCGSRPTQKT